MKRLKLHLVALAAVVLVLGAGSYAVAGDSRKTIDETLIGYEEVPSISTTGSGRFTARISNDASRIDWTLSYRALEGDVQQAHIHFAQRAVNGGISVFFCSNLGNAPAGTQACPPPPATISGTIRPSDVIGPAGQGIEPGAFDELVAAIRAGYTYANVHSSKWPGGEIRAQLLDDRKGRGNEDKNDDGDENADENEDDD
jgi:CHRD domain-containing protein